MKIRRSLAVGVGAALLAPLVLPGAATAADPDPVTTKARAYLLTQQQADGGFEVAGFPGFETPDAIAALAAIAQTTPAWDEAAALAAVQGATTSGGKSPLDAMDDQVDGEEDPSSDAAATRATKAIALVAAPLGLDPTDFDPSNDSEEPVDLIGRMNAHRLEDGSYDLGSYFGGVLFAAVALDAVGQSPTPAHVAQIKAGQRPDGSWDYTGTPAEGPGNDIDTTASAMIALAKAGLDRTDPAVAKAIAWLLPQRGTNGAWQAFGADDPNATAMASIALSALHVDVATNGATNPYTWLRTQQLATGRIQSPSDGFGINTFPTSQTVEALSRQLYLRNDREALIWKFSRDLASPANDPRDDRSNQLASDALGPNPSVKSARVASATAVVNGPDGRIAAAADIFQAALGRNLDPSGSAYWSGKLQTISRPEMLARITGSNEYYRTAGGTIPAFVDRVYQSVLGRGSDPSGRAFWIRQLQNGRSVQAVARSLTASAEYRRNQVNATYERILDRAPTAGELTYWTGRIATTRIEVLIATLGGSIELYDSLVSS